MGGQVISNAGENLQNSAFISREQLMGLSFLLFSAQRIRLWSKNLEYAFKLPYFTGNPWAIKISMCCIFFPFLMCDSFKSRVLQTV